MSLKRVPRSGLDEDVAAFTKSKKRGKGSLKRFIQGSSAKKYDVPIVPFSRINF